MKHAHSTIFTTLRLLALALVCVVSAAHADEFGDVNALLRAGKLGEALSKADAYLVAKPRDPQMRFLKGVIQRTSGKSAEAITTFTKLTEDYPELPEPYNNLAVLYASQSQFDKARVALEMAIRTNPSYATAHENLGDVYARLASQAYSKALQFDSASAAVPPKLALIRELFSPTNKGQHPGVPVAALATPAAIAAKPAASAPTPVAAPTPAASIPAAVPAKPVASVPVAVPAKPVARTPVAIAAKPAASRTTPESGDVELAVRAWAKAWAAKDLTTYLGAYGKEFAPPATQSRSAWEEERKQRITGKSSITVKLENLSVARNGTSAIARFRQSYRADALAVSSRKTLELHLVEGRWVIVRESVDR